MSPFHITSFAGMTAVALGAALFARRLAGSHISPVLVGALLWATGVAAKAAVAIPSNESIRDLLVGSLGEGAGNAVFMAYVGLLTGVFECGAVYVAFRASRRLRQYDRRSALACGIGFGAVEAQLLALSSLAIAIVSAVAPGALPARLTSDPPLWALPAPIVERLSTLPIHAFATLAVIYGVLWRRPAWILSAVGFKSLVDAVAAWGILSLGYDSPGRLWLIEALVAALGAVALFGIAALERRWKNAPCDPAAGADRCAAS